MVKRFCILFPDGSLTIVSRFDGEAASLGRARTECQLYNKGEKKKEHLAMIGEIEIDLMSFKERF